MEVRQVLFFTSWMLFQQVKLLLRVGLDTLLRKEEGSPPPPPPQHFPFCEEKLR